MRKLALSATLLITACDAASPSATRNVFGPDNREDVGAERPYSAVGRLDSGCTGTLIGRRLVLTAAHCIIDSATRTVKPEVTYFRPGLRDGASRRPVWMNYAWLGSDQPEDQRIADWAIVRLDETAGDEFGSLGVHTVAFSDALPYTVDLVGYSRDRDQGDRPGLHRGCYVHEVVDRKLFHDCDGTAGISGAPLLKALNGNTYVLGLTVSEYRQGAPDSVFRDGYSRDYANVALPAEVFASAVRTLLQTADAGVAAPAIAGVVEMANPNARVPDTDDPDRPRDPGRVYTVDHVRDRVVLSRQGPAFREAFPRLRSALAELVAAAEEGSDQRLAGIARELDAAAAELNAGLARVVAGRVVDGYRDYVYDLYAPVHSRESLLRRYDLSRRLGSDAAEAASEARDDVQRAVRDIEALIFDRA